MRATLEWSHDLLSGPERELFQRLSVFAGGFSLEAAEEVGSSKGAVELEEVLEVLGRLAEQSLVTVKQEPNAPSRYGMLEPVRQYARGLLEEGGEAEEVRRRHAGHYLALAEQAKAGLRGSDQVLWMRRLEAELDNLRAAIGWYAERGEGESLARIAWSSWQFWWWGGHSSEGRRWTEEALARGTALSASDRAKLLFVAGSFAQDDLESARTMIEESIGLFRQLGYKEGLYHPLGTAGLMALGQGRYEEALALMEECVDLQVETGEEWGSSIMMGYLAATRLTVGDIARARRLAERGLSLAREIGSRASVFVALHTLAAVARAEGDHERAARFFEEGLAVSAELGEATNVAYCLEGLAQLFAAEAGPKEDLARAARLWGAAEAILEATEVAAYAYTPDRSLHNRQVTAARERLDERAWTQAWAEGRAMGLEEAVAYALEKDEASPPAP